MSTVGVTIGMSNCISEVIQSMKQKTHLPLNSTGTATAICRTVALSTYTVMPELKARIILG